MAAAIFMVLALVFLLWRTHRRRDRLAQPGRVGEAFNRATYRVGNRRRFRLFPSDRSDGTL